MKTRLKRTGLMKRTFMLVAIASILTVAKANVAFAATDATVPFTKEVTDLSPLGDDCNYPIESIDGLRETSVVTVTTDNPEVADIFYTSVKKKKSNGSDDYGHVDSVVITGSDRKLENGYYLNGLEIAPKSKGQATITVQINTDGMIVNQIYNVTVKGYKPKYGKLSEKTIRTCDTASIRIDNVTPYAKVMISSNKNKAFTVDSYNSKADKYKPIYIGKKPREIKNFDELISITPKKTGNIKIKVSIYQDGETTKRNYTLKVKKYVNPVKSFKIDQKDYAKKFDKRSSIGDSKGLTAAECKYTLGKRFHLQLKDGYKLVKITYRKQGEWWPMKVHTISKTTTTLPKDFWELYIVYKDKDGKQYENSMYYSGSIFSDLMQGGK